MALITALRVITERCNPDFPIDGIRIDCSSIAEVIRIYQEQLNITLAPQDGPGECFSAALRTNPHHPATMDIHVVRRGKDLCVKKTI